MSDLEILKRRYVDLFQGVDGFDVMVRKTGTPAPFMGSQPLQLTKDDTIHVLRPGIEVTPKVDGQRFFLYVDADFFALIGRDNQWQFPFGEKVNLTNQFPPDVAFLFDVEATWPGSSSGEIVIFVMDYLFCRIKGRTFNCTLDPYAQRMKSLVTLWRPGGAVDATNRAIEPLGGVLYFKNNLTIKVSSFPGSEKQVYGDWINLMRFKKESHVPEFDGLIFVNRNIEGTFMPHPSYGTFKWKPLDQLTVDLLFDRNKVYTRNGTPWKPVGKVVVNTEGFDLDNGVTYEFAMNLVDKRTLELVPVKGPREKGPNADATLATVWRAFVDPVRLPEVAMAFVDHRLPDWMSKPVALAFLRLYVGKIPRFKGHAPHPKVTKGEKQQNLLLFQKAKTIELTGFDEYVDSGVAAMQPRRNYIGAEKETLMVFELPLVTKFKKGQSVVQRMINVSRQYRDAVYLVHKMRAVPGTRSLSKVRKEIAVQISKTRREYYLYDFEEGKWNFNRLERERKESSIPILKGVHGYNVTMTYKNTGVFGDAFPPRNPETLPDVRAVRVASVTEIKLDDNWTLRATFVREDRVLNDLKHTTYKAFIECVSLSPTPDDVTSFAQWMLKQILF